MQSLIHGLNIGTLATWLSVTGLGSVAVITPHWEPSPPAPAAALEPVWLEDDFTLGDGGPADGGGLPSTGGGAHSPVETLPAPPELEPLAQHAPLPEIPSLPPPAARQSTDSNIKSADVSRAAAPRAASRAGSGSPRDAGTGRSAAATGHAGSGRSSGMSDASRLAAGRMPAPVYPAECRRKGQTGTVVVEFTVDSSGRVISAHAKSPSRWPLLNNEAVRTVRCWKFPPGGVMKLQRPIVFQLR
jgi:protein TonB